MVIIVFERVGNATDEPASNGCLQEDAINLLTDISNFLDDRKPVYLKAVTLNKTFGLDLIESILSNHVAIVRTRSQFVEIIRDKIAPALISGLKDSSLSVTSAGEADFARSCRVWRLAQILIESYHDIFPAEIEIIVAFFGRILDDPSSPLWEQALVLEVAKGIFSAPLLLEEIYDICERGADEDASSSPASDKAPVIFRDLIVSMIACINRMLNVISNIQPVPSQPEPWNLAACEAAMKISCLNLVDRHSPPAVPPAYLIVLSYDALNSWITNTAQCAIRNRSNNDQHNLGTVKLIGATESALVAIALLMYGSFSRYRQYQMENSLLIFMSRLIQTLSLLNYHNEMNLFLRQLGSLALPEILLQDPFIVAQLHATGLNVSPQNRAILRMLLNTMCGEGGLVAECLGQEGWCSLAWMLHGVDQIISFRIRRQQQQGIAPNASSSTSLQEEESVLAQIIEASNDILDMVASLSNQQAVNFVKGVGSVTAEGFKVLQSNPLSAASVLLPFAKGEKLISLLLPKFCAHPKSLAEAWAAYWELLMIGAQCDETTVRLQTIHTINRLTKLFLDTCTVARMKQGATLTASESTYADHLQICLVAPMAETMSLAHAWPDLLRSLLDDLLRYVQMYGEVMEDSAWNLLWRAINITCKEITSILQESATQQDEIRNMPISNQAISTANNGANIGASSVLYKSLHELVKIVCSDYLSYIAVGEIGAFIDIVAALGTINIPGELNIPLNSVRYLWDISDFLSASNGSSRQRLNSTAFPLWMRVLRHLSALSLDIRPELRNSAIQTLLRTITLNGSTLKAEKGEWTAVFDEILFPFFANLRIAAVAAASSSSSLGSPIADVLAGLDLPAKCPDIASSASSPPPMGFVHFTRDSVAKQWDESEAAAMQNVTSLLQTHFHTTLSPLAEFGSYWRRWLAILKDYALLRKGKGSIELTTVSISCLFNLIQLANNSSGKVGLDAATLPASGTFNAVLAAPRWKELWQVWCEIGEEGFKNVTKNDPDCSNYINFTQDSLLKYLKMLAIMINVCAVDLSWLQRSLVLIGSALQCPTPSDPIRDIDSPSELQRFSLNWIFSETTTVAADGAVKSLILETASSWLDLLPTNSASSAPFATRSAPNAHTSTFIAITSAILEHLPVSFSSWQTEPTLYKAGTVIMLLKACGRLMRLKYQCPSNSRCDPLWKTATVSFISIATAALSNDSLWAMIGNGWDEFVSLLDAVLHEAMSQRANNVANAVADERFDSKLYEFIVSVAIPKAAGHSDNGALKGLILLINNRLPRELPVNLSLELGGPMMLPSGLYSTSASSLLDLKETLSFSALNCLFDLAALNVASKIALPLLLTHCQVTFRAAIADRRLAMQLPFNRFRTAHMAMLVDRLRKLKVPAEIPESQCEPFRFLYGELVSIMSIQLYGYGDIHAERLIKDGCKEMLRIVGKELLGVKDLDIATNTDMSASLHQEIGKLSVK